LKIDQTMLTPLTAAFERVLSPATVHRLRSFKRRILGQPPLLQPYSFEASLARNPTRSKLVAKLGRRLGRIPILQDVALEKYDNSLICAPYLIYNEDQVLVLLGAEIAKAITLSVAYTNSAAVVGDIAEFGTMGGFTARTIATAMVFDPRRQPTSPLRQLRLFDSFEGLPEIISEIDRKAPHVLSGAWRKGGCKVLGPHELRAMVGGVISPERFTVHEGWFADTVKALPPETRFAMVHFDGDLYQSTMDALEPCFGRGFISPGAVFLFDDWNCNHADPSYGERRAWSELVERFHIKATHCGDYSELGTKFIVHSYDGMPAG
jgi:O-methyltransferase